MLQTASQQQGQWLAAGRRRWADSATPEAGQHYVLQAWHVWNPTGSRIPRVLLLCIVNRLFVMLFFDVPLADTEPACWTPTAITFRREQVAQHMP